MCLLWSTNWVFISQKTTFFKVTAVITSNLTGVKLVTCYWKSVFLFCLLPPGEFGMMVLPLHGPNSLLTWWPLNSVLSSAREWLDNILRFRIFRMRWGQDAGRVTELSVDLFIHLADCLLWLISTLTEQTNKQTNSVALSPRANYTDWATATCRRNLVPTLADRGVSRGQRGGSPTVVNLSFLDRSPWQKWLKIQNSEV
jgi:hypothetical protein